MTHLLEVENIKCGVCINSIKTALQKIATVSDVEINKETDTIIVNAETERELLIETLSQIGYPEKGHNTLLHKGKSFLSCAIGNMTK